MYSASPIQDTIQGDIIQKARQIKYNISIDNVYQAKAHLANFSATIETPLTIIVSHSCDATKTNPSNSGRNVLVAPLLELKEPFEKRLLKDSGLSDITEINVIVENRKNVWNLHYLEPHTAIGGKKYYVDLTHMFSIKWDDVITDDKLLELDEDNKKYFAEKIIANFYHG